MLTVLVFHQSSKQEEHPVNLQALWGQNLNLSMNILEEVAEREEEVLMGEVGEELKSAGMKTQT